MARQEPIGAFTSDGPALPKASPTVSPKSPLRFQMLLGQMCVFCQRHPGVLHVILEWMCLELGIMLSVRERESCI